MNTSKQVNAMIGLLGLLVLVLFGYFLYEGTRQAEARDEIVERDTQRGAHTFVRNCRTCHGIEGKGPEEGAVAPALNNPAFLILEENNEFGVPATTEGEALQIRNFLTTTIACGRTGTFMPTWSERFGGPLSDTQIEQLVTMITTPGGFEVVHEQGAEADAETGATAKDIVVSDPSQLAVTASNCGQYTGEAAAVFRQRDPFSAEPSAPPTAATPTSTPEPPVAGANAVRTTLREWAVEAPASAAAGPLAFQVQNGGAVAHELVVIKSDAAPDALPVAAGLVDERRVQVSGKLPQIQGGQSRNLNVTLEPGKYVLICNIPGHYALGMRAGFTAQ